MYILDFIMNHFTIIIMLIILAMALCVCIPGEIKGRKMKIKDRETLARLECEGAYKYYESLSNEKLAKAYTELQIELDEKDRNDDGCDYISYKQEFIEEISDNRGFELFDFIDEEIYAKLASEGVFKYYESLSDQELLKAYDDLEKMDDMWHEYNSWEINCKETYIEEILKKHNVKLSDDDTE